jgi:N-acyl-D-amino-acid deacylase
MDETTVIRGGTVVDGTGAPGRRADVAIRGGRVVEVGEDLDGDRVIDASGMVVAPGFIDIHTHYDAQVFWDPALTPSVFHGVTTVVAGNCGFSIAPTRPEDRELIANTLQKVEDMDPASLMAGIPWEFETFPEYLSAVERRGTVLNFAAYLGHTPLRLYVMGAAASERTADDAEIERMTGLVRAAMDAGAAGFATSFAITHLGADGRPIPSRLADKDELRALFSAVGESGRGVLGINGGEGLTLREVYAMQPEVGAPATYTALLTQPSGAHMKALEIHRDGVAKGADVWPQVSCRPLSFSMVMTEPFTLNTNPVFAELMPRSFDERRAAYADPGWRRRARRAWDAGQGLPPRWDTFEIMLSAANPDL